MNNIFIIQLSIINTPKLPKTKKNKKKVVLLTGMVYLRYVYINYIIINHGS